MLTTDRTDQPLPFNWDLVAVSKKERDAILATGRNPDRKEADFDPATNKPTNTLYVGEPRPVIE